MKEDDINRQETDFIIEQSLNLYVIYKLFKEELINETEYIICKKKLRILNIWLQI